MAEGGREARVAGRSYLGGATRLSLSLEGLAINALLSAGTPVPALGESVRVAWNDADLHIMEQAP